MNELVDQLDWASELYKQKRYQDCIDVCEIVRQQEKWNSRAIKFNVYSLSNLGSFRNAIELLAEACRANPEAGEFSRFLIDICKVTGNKAYAESLFLDLIIRHPNSIGPWSSLISSKIFYEEYGEALQLAENLADSDQQNLELLAGLIDYHSKRDQYELQISAMVATVKRSPSTLGLITKCADLADRIGDRDTWNYMSKLAVPCLLRDIESKKVNKSIFSEALIYQFIVKKRESEQNYYEYFSAWSNQMVEFGRTFQSEIHLPAHNMQTLNVAFILPNGSFLGHTEVMLSLIASRFFYDEIDVKPIVYCFGKADERLSLEADKLNVEIIDLPKLLSNESTSDWLRILTAVREDIVSKGISMAVWVSVPTAILFSFAFKIAPIQIYWTLKFHPFSFKEIDGYISYGSIFGGDKNIHGQTWKTFPISTSVDSIPVDEDVLSKLRNQLGNFDTILGCLAREEKFNDDEYIDMVIRILSDNENCIYLWTGMNVNQKVQKAFENAGLAERTKFIGWVDTNVYAQLIDVFLEPFLFGCGITAFQSMNVGTPLVVLHKPITSLGINFHSIIESLSSNPDAYEKISELINPANGEPGLAYAMNAQEYYEMACKLIRDKAYRSAVGGAYKKFYGELLNRPDLSAKAFFQRCHEVYLNKISLN